MAFGPSGPTISTSATGTSKSLAWPISQQCRIVNTSTTLSVYVQFGVGSATAVIPTADNATGTACTVVPPMGQTVVDVPAGSNFIAVIASGAGPTLVYTTPGIEQ